MLRPFAHPADPVACCYVLLRVVAQSLKPVKLSAMCKRTQQNFGSTWPTELRPFAGPADHVACCYVLQGVVAQCLKPVKLSALGVVGQQWANNGQQRCVRLHVALVNQNLQFDVSRFYVFIAFCKDIQGPYCIRKKGTVITSTHSLPSLSLNKTFFVFCCIESGARDFLYFFFLPPENPRDIAFIPSLLMRLQKWRVS